MTNLEIVAIENAGRAAMAWIPEGHDGVAHYRWLVAALLPAAAILVVAAIFLGRLLAAA